MDCDICVVTKLKFQLDILSSPRVSKEERRLKIEIFFEADCSSWIEYTSREPGLRTIREKRKKIGEKAKQGKGGRKERRKEELGYYGNQATFWSVWHAKRSLEAKMSNNIYGAPCGKSKLAKRRRYLRPISSWSAMSSSSSSLIVCFLLEAGGVGGYKSEKTLYSLQLLQRIYRPGDRWSNL